MIHSWLRDRKSGPPFQPMSLIGIAEMHTVAHTREFQHLNTRDASSNMIDNRLIIDWLMMDDCSCMRRSKFMIHGSWTHDHHLLWSAGRPIMINQWQIIKWSDNLIWYQKTKDIIIQHHHWPSAIRIIQKMQWNGKCFFIGHWPTAAWINETTRPTSNLIHWFIFIHCDLHNPRCSDTVAPRKVCWRDVLFRILLAASNLRERKAEWTRQSSHDMVSWLTLDSTIINHPSPSIIQRSSSLSSIIPGPVTSPSVGPSVKRTVFTIFISFIAQTHSFINSMAFQ